MKKLSELLRICSEYNVYWGGRSGGMCGAADQALYFGKISWAEGLRVQKVCTELVESLGGGMYLSSVILDRFNVESVDDTVRQVYEAWIDYLEENGK